MPSVSCLLRRALAVGKEKKGLGKSAQHTHYSIHSHAEESRALLPALG